MPPEPKCSTIYGPLHSRRNGVSLGVNLGRVEEKICTWGCVYCQCSFGERGRIGDQPEFLPTVEGVVRELIAALNCHPQVQTVTLAGNTEPTSHPQFPAIVKAVAELRRARGDRWRFVLFSNGTELQRPEVVSAFSHLDEAWLKLDCASEPLFQKLNRPLALAGGLEEHLARMSHVKPLLIQSIFWRCPPEREGWDNFTPTNLEGLLTLYRRLAPDRVNLLTIKPERSLPWILPVSERDLAGFAGRVGEITKVEFFS